MSLSLNDRFSRIAAPRVPQHQQTVHVNLSGVQQQPQRGRMIEVRPRAGGKVQQQQQQRQAQQVKARSVISSANARADRRAQTQDRVTSARERTLANKRAAIASTPKQLPKSQVPVNLAQPFLFQPPIQPLTTPFQLAPQFTQQPAFNIGQRAPQQQQTATRKKGTTGAASTKKKSTTAQASKPAKRTQANGNSRQARAQQQQANGGAKKKGAAAVGASSASKNKKAPGAAKQANGAATVIAAPVVTKDALDADMETYMAAAPQ